MKKKTDKPIAETPDGVTETKERRKHRAGRWIQYILAGVVILLVAIAVATIAGLYVKLDELGNQLAYLQDTTDIIQTNVTNMEANIEATLEESASLIEDYSITVLDCDFAAGTYDVAISVLPKEYSDTTRTSIYFGTREYLLELDGYSYCGTATLPLDASYDGNVTILFTDGDRRSTEVLRNYVGFQQSLSGVLQGSIANIPRYKDGVLTVRDNAAANLDGNDIYQFTQFELVVTADDREIYDYDLLANTGGVIDEGTVEDDVEGTASAEAGSVETAGAGEDGESALRPNESAGAEELPEDMEVSAGESDEETDADSRSNFIDAVSGFSTERELNLEYELAAGTTVRIFLRATTVDGFEFIYDLFTGVTSEEEAEGFVPSEDYFKSNYAIYDRKDAVYYIEN